jgi:thiamine biosynthesis lipoprotein
VDPELARLLAVSISHAARTRGAFDPTVGPLVALWDEAGRRGSPPAREKLAAARARVGWRGLRAAPPDRVELAPAGASLDLGAIAKGYALDRMADALRADGIEAALMSFGQSSIRAIGAPPGELAWRILVRRPEGGFAGVASLRDRSLSVSASLGQGVWIAGRLYGHVVDPRSGEPISRRAEAVVVAPEAAAAEAWSTAWLVLGAEGGLALLERERECEGLWLEPGGRVLATRGWREATRFEDTRDGGSGEDAPAERGHLREPEDAP